MKEQKKIPTEEKKNTPKTFSIGNAKLTEFTNKHDGNEFKSIKVSKFYTKDNGTTWEETDTFSPQELIKLRMVIEEYLRFIFPLKTK